VARHSYVQKTAACELNADAVISKLFRGGIQQRFVLQISRNMSGQRYLVYHKRALMSMSPCVCSQNGKVPARRSYHYFHTFTFYKDQRLPFLKLRKCRVEGDGMASQELPLQRTIALVTTEFESRKATLQTDDTSHAYLAMKVMAAFVT
jgi:hypothetical protein